MSASRKSKPKPVYEIGDRFRANGGSSAMPYRDKEIVVVQVLNPKQSMYLMAAEGEHFEAHRDWLYSYWEKVDD